MALAPLLLLGLVAGAPAASAAPTPEARFDRMAGAHLDKLQALGATRGVAVRDQHPLTLAALRALLAGAFGRDTAVLVYAHRSPEGVLDAWLVGPEGLRASASTPIDAGALADAVAGLPAALGADVLAAARAPRPRGLVRPPPGPARSAARGPGALARLGALLLPPPIAAGLAPVRELLIAPTLGLGAVPFAALELGGRALVEERTVSVLPSLFGLGAVGRARSGPLRPALVVGDPDLSGDPAWDFPPLPGARAEALRVAERTGAAPLLGRAATRQAVEERAGQAALVYLATHGVALPDRPLEGFLALSGPSGVDRWTAREIQRGGLRARLAVLSACQTGLGQGHEGGVIGVARAFQLAGVPAVVMSLWSVDDDATAALMGDFLDLAEARPPAEALREAMLRARRRDPDPRRWAAFALFATPPGRPAAGLGQGGARLALEAEGGRLVEDGGRLPAGQHLRLRVLGDEEAPRRHRYLVEVDPAGAVQLVGWSGDAGLTFTPPVGRETLLLLEADRPAGGLAGPLDGSDPRPVSLADLAALFPLEDPALRLRILQLQVQTFTAGPPAPRP